MRWAGRQKEKGKRQKEEAEQLLLAEAALSTLARVERAPELSADLRRRITGTRVGGLRWGWVGAGAVAAIMIVVAVAVWPRGGGEGMRSGRREVVEATGAREQAADSRVVEPPQAVREGIGEAKAFDGGAPPVGRACRRLHARRAQEYTAGTAGGDAPRNGLGDIPALQAQAPSEGAGQQQAAFAEPPPPRLRGPGAAASKAPAERDTPAEPVGGVILVLGRPEPVQVSGSCYVEVTLADGTRTVREQTVERDAAGRPQMVRLSYERSVPGAAVQQGG